MAADPELNFEQAYGKPFKAMTRAEKDMAMLNQLYYLRKRIDSFKWLERVGWVAMVVIPVLAGWMAWLSRYLLGNKVN